MGCGGSVPVKTHAGGQDEGSAPPASVNFPVVTSISEHYAVEDELRKGSFATCYRARRVKQTNAWTRAALSATPAIDQVVVVKRVERVHPAFKYEAVMREVRVMRALRHKSVIDVVDYCEDASALYIILELAPGGDLYDRLESGGALSEPDSALVICQILDGLVYMHGNGFCHRDLKPENILMMSADKDSPAYNTIKITDFGLSTDQAQGYLDTMATPCGTPDFTSPELINCAATRAHYSCKVDMWSVGAILYCLLAGVPPFSFQTGQIAVMIKKILNAAYRFPAKHFADVSHEAQACVKCLMQVSPDLRPTAAECLQHEWFELVTSGSAHSGGHVRRSSVSSQQSAQLTTRSMPSPARADMASNPDRKSDGDGGTASHASLARMAGGSRERNRRGSSGALSYRSGSAVERISGEEADGEGGVSLLPDGSASSGGPGGEDGSSSAPCGPRMASSASLSMRYDRIPSL